MSVMACPRWVPYAMAAWLVLVAGYTIFYGVQSHVYTNFIDVGNLLAYQFNLPGPQHFFAVSAYTTAGAISPLSEELAESSRIFVTNPGDQSDAVGTRIHLQIVVKAGAVTYAASNL